MNLSDLKTALELVTDQVFEREAPAGARRYIVWHVYNFEQIRGDDHAPLRLPRVQLDIYWQSRMDTILDELISVLDYYRLPFDVQDLTWDDERMLNRAILQLTLI